MEPVDYGLPVVGAVNLATTLYIGISAYNRKIRWWSLWALPALLLGVLVIPFFRAFRPLKDDETRSGGKLYLVLRDFARIIILVFGLSYAVVFVAGIGGMESANTDAGEAGVFMGMSLSAICILPIMLMVWIIPRALRSDQTEEGPTGPLAE